MRGIFAQCISFKLFFSYKSHFVMLQSLFDLDDVTLTSFITNSSPSKNSSVLLLHPHKFDSLH